MLCLCAPYKLESSFDIYVFSKRWVHSCQASWFGMSKMVRKKINLAAFFLISKYFLQFGFVRTSPSNVTIIYATVHKRNINIFPRYFAPIRLIWFFHVRFLSNNTLKNLIWSTRFVRALFIFNNGKTSGMLYLCLNLMEYCKVSFISI